MSGKGMSAYKANLETQVLEGLITGDLGVLQQGRTLPGGVSPGGGSLCECAVNPTHCFRTVSQRELTVTTRFQSDDKAIAATDDIFDNLFTSASGALGDLTPGSGDGVVFNDANVNSERRRIYNMVLFAMKARIDIELKDAEVLSVNGSIDVAELARDIEQIASHYIAFKLYHSADRADPWVDSTPLSYLMRPQGQYLLVPPVKWIDRDPAMELVVEVAEKGGGAGAAPVISNPVRGLQGSATVVIDCLFLPDPDMCPNLWPGKICPKENIANTPWYSGKIQSAKRSIKGLVK